MDTIKKARIANRYTRCTCGCKGQDSWHAKKFTRTIRNVRKETGTANTKAIGTLKGYDAVGTAKFPWGTEIVIRWAGSWFLTHDITPDSEA